MDWGRTIQKLNLDWKFHRGVHGAAWNKGFDDGPWRTVTLPHDWSVEEPFSQDHSSGTGYLPAGTGVYRKHFALTESARGRRVSVTFEGVYNHSQVWCNGYYLGKRPYGYSTFTYDLTDFAAWGGDNVLTVKVDHKDVADSRWFTGSGIYRDVWLTTTDPVHFTENGVFVTTPEVSPTEAVIAVQSWIDNDTAEDAVVSLRTSLRDPEGMVVGESEELLSLKPGSRSEVLQRITVIRPRLWSPETPHLYSVRSQVIKGGREADGIDTPCGVRWFQFDPSRGFSLNGNSMKLKGVCVHHDAGCLGAAVPDPVWRKRLLALKEMGCNAIRTAHNPPSPGLLDLCDQLGFLVMDEAFDEWEGVKNKWSKGHNDYPPQHFGSYEDFPEWGERDLQAMVLRDRNHPSIILWSIGNEIDYPNDPYCHPLFQEATGNNDANKPAAERIYDPNRPSAARLVPLAQRLVRWVKECDTSRPVTAALAFPELSNLTGLAAALDVVGYNYKEQCYRADHETYPDRVIYGSENGGHLEAWRAVEELEHNSGMFVWTGIDYLGEARGWPIRASGAGFLNLAGTRKPRYFFYQSLWSSLPVLFLSTRVQPESHEVSQHRFNLGEPHWNWAHGNKVDVFCLTNADEGELFLNGRSCGIRRLTDSASRFLQWTLDYEPGALSVTARWGAQTRTMALETTSTPLSIVMTADQTTLRADGQEITELEIHLVDAQGRRVQTHPAPVTVSVEGPGRILGLENGDIQDLTPYSSPCRTIHQGRLVAYVRTTTTPGTMTLLARADGLGEAVVRVETLPAQSVATP